MIESIQSLKRFGIFEDYSASDDLKDFNQFNLIYGWNGSGKSTLSKVFECLAKKQIIADFPDADFLIKTTTGNITSRNIGDHELDVCVFNSNFIKENIDWDSVVKSILLISQEKIDDKKLLKEKTISFKSASSKLQELEASKHDLEKEKVKVLSQIAKNVKQRLEILDSSDSYYVSYNRTKVISRLNALGAKIKTKELILTPSSYEEMKRSAAPKFKDPITTNFRPVDCEILDRAADRLNSLLSQAAVSVSIDFLRDNPNIQKWVEHGLKIHEHSDQCYFCSAPLSTARFDELNNHFSQAFVQLKSRLIAAQDWVSQIEIPAQPQLNEGHFFEEYFQPVPNALNDMADARLAIESAVNQWLDLLNVKIDNPFETALKVDKIPTDALAKYNQACELINRQIDSHNRKSVDFKNRVEAAKKALEDHFLTEEIHDTGLLSIFQQVEAADAPIAEQSFITQKLGQEIQALEKSLSDEAIGADKFNGLLHKFLGRNHIELTFDQTQKGYRIIRQPEKKPALNLSEGEKNAIGLVYFLTKLDENGRDLKDCTVVMDDPVSSFDSNNLFNTHSFLRNRCQNAKQLILLTHNFVYFKLARDWLSNKNKPKDGKIKSHFYQIEATIASPRRSSIRNASNSLLEHNSEYGSVFECLLKHVDTPELDIDQSFAIANMSRKVLEAFLTFKFPSFRGDFNSLVSKAITDDSLRERIYRFINKYSHNQIIEFDNLGVDNVVYESQFIVRDILSEIKRLDKDHYDGMIDSLQSQKAN